MPSALAVIKKKPTEEEQKWLQAISKPGAKIESRIPKDIKQEDWNFAMSITCRALRRAELQEQALLPVLGRLLLVTQDNPELIAKHKTFKEFLQAEVAGEFGVGVSTCYEAMTIAARFPDLTNEQYESISRRNFKLLAKAIPKGDEKKPAAKALIEKAAELSDKEFVDHCVKKNYIAGGGSPIGTVISIATNKQVEAHWNKFIEDPRTHAVVGSDNAGKILDAMIAECSSWFADAEDQAAVDVVAEAV